MLEVQVPGITTEPDGIFACAILNVQTEFMGFSHGEAQGPGWATETKGDKTNSQTAGSAVLAMKVDEPVDWQLAILNFSHASGKLWGLFPS